MQNFFLCSLFCLFGLFGKEMQGQNKGDLYEDDWLAISKLDTKSLPKSALEATEKLYAKIERDNKNPFQLAQSIKAILYINRYQIQLEEEGVVKAIHRFEGYVKDAQGIKKALLQSMLAEAYTQYMSSNYYKFRNRIVTTDFKPEDISTWSLDRLSKKAKELYLLSLEEEKSKDFDLEQLQSILSSKHQKESYYLTLEDLLLHRAISFFKTDHYYLTQPAYKFYVDQEVVFDDAKKFIDYSFTAKDSIANSFNVLRLYQQLLSIHLAKKDSKAFLYFNLERLQFARNKSIFPDKKVRYIEAVKNLAKKYAKDQFQSTLQFEIASYHRELGQKYNPNSSDQYRWELQKAVEICEKAIKDFPKTAGAMNCQNLIYELQRKSFAIQAENFTHSADKILFGIHSTNLSKLYFRIIQLDDKQLKALRKLNYDKKLDFLRNQKPLRNWSVDLLADKDYQKHFTETMTASLPYGQYMVLASANKAFSYQANQCQYSSFRITDLAIIKRQEQGEHYFYVVDRKSGQPLEGVNCEFYKTKYNYTKKEYEHITLANGKTDKDGYIHSSIIPKHMGKNRNFQLKAQHKEDILDLGSSSYNSTPSTPYKKQEVHFYTDRRLYRPGQTIYFKGIVLEKLTNGKKPVIVPNSKRRIIFYDVNHQKVHEMELTSNEYGSFHGNFIAPSSGLLGSMRIQDSGSGRSKYIRVEEYKRPKFEVSFLPIKESFKLEDSVEVKGEAIAYAGSKIDGAKVSYRIVRKAHFPYWPWWRYGRYVPFDQNEQNIAYGETTTDENGEFKLRFKALRDRSIPMENDPEFNYTVYADVVDITGETHSSSTNVRIGAIALKVNISGLKKQMNKDLDKGFSVQSFNLNNQFEAAKGSIKIESLQTPKHSFINRLWTQPDYLSISQEDYNEHLPNLPINGEEKIQNWPVIKTVFSTKFDTEQNKEINLKNFKRWKQGKYKLTLNTADKYGKEITIIRYFTVLSPKDKHVPTNEELFLAQKAFYSMQPGDDLSINFGSISKNSYFLYEVEHEGKRVHSEWIKSSERQKRMIEIEEKHRGNFFFHITKIQHSRFQNQVGSIYVPWKNKDLKIEYSTFRDKLLPGQKEEWTIKISGAKKDKINAELLASMYDASLDALGGSNSYYLDVHPHNYSQLYWQAGSCFSAAYKSDLAAGWTYPWAASPPSIYTPQLNWFGLRFSNYYYRRNRLFKSAARGRAMEEAKTSSVEVEEMNDAVMSVEGNNPVPAPPLTSTKLEDKKDEATLNQEEPSEAKPEDFSEVKVRTNLNETVFFFPQLKTDEEGNILLSFTMNEALTRWKLLLLAHTQELEIASSSKEVITQKDLMVMPNPPRFFRQGDEIHFTAKVSNLSKETLKGKATLQLFDAITMKPIDQTFGNSNAVVDFSTEQGRSAGLSWKLNIPRDFVHPVTYRVIAKAGDFSDGEESSLPVLSNRMLVTETQPLPVRGKTTKQFTFKRMKEVSKSTTMQHHKLTLEFTQNPAWYAVQALPYLMEYPYECTEQIFSRYYANSLASSVANAHPKVKRVFDQWKNIDTDALKSNLQKNQELKYALLEETPWVMNAQSEEQQKKNIGLLFDLNRMSNELTKAKKKLIDRQAPNGGFSWFPGGRHSWYITQYVVEGFGHLDVLKVEEVRKDKKTMAMLKKAVGFIDEKLAIHYKKLRDYAQQYHANNVEEYLAKDHLGYMPIHYMYARSFFPEINITNKQTQEALAYYEDQTKKYWLNKSDYMQGMLALATHRKGEDKETPKAIVKSLKERALNSEEMGMYWKYPSGYFWYQLPIETHSLMIEVFAEVAQDKQAVDDLKTWLLKAKQTTHWKTTKATASACYALLSNGDNWLLEDQEIVIHMGGKKLDQSTIKKEAGTGYFKTTWEANEIKNEMAEVKVKNPNNVVAWGALYWQYFEDMDKITHFKETPLKMNKKVFKVVQTDRGEVLTPIDKVELQPGDKLKVRIELFVDRDMEYVHMKDARAAGLEPINVLSRYKYQGGLGYYESTKDASTNFFFSYLSKGSYVFEYPLRVNHKGDFSNGITTIQCMYAPEFTAHSEGIRMKIK